MMESPCLVLIGFMAKMVDIPSRLWLVSTLIITFTALLLCKDTDTVDLFEWEVLVLFGYLLAMVFFLKIDKKHAVRKLKKEWLDIDQSCRL